ncbi:hypothetical protein QR680_015345 [Steinernema hermaphroditum]|uniref:Uncharacterized protein n=1 Tax=Steinernema hermaphroditum TaxID=289476 RepID=A0AA39LKN7_9BILA|nr:hypothetical protein QR680_015345 [Steinernema hermaphroditum]
MELYLLQHETWKKLYSCDYLTNEEWDSHRVPRVFHGTVSIVFAAVATVLYVPCIITMRTPAFFANSCYKIMFYVGLVDLCSQVIDGFVNGYLLIIGAEFCTMPHFIYISGTLVFASWSTQCLLCLLLALNRLCDIVGTKNLNFFFSGWRTHISCLLIIAYGIVVTFIPPSVVFESSAGGSWFYDPYAAYKDIHLPGINRSWYFNYLMGINNISVVVLLFVLYPAMLIKLYLKGRGGNQAASKFQKSIFYQAALICFLTTVPAVSYLYMQMFYTPEWLISLGHFVWQASNGAPAFVYLAFNRSIRRNVIRMICAQNKNEVMAVSDMGGTTVSRI